MKYLIGTKLPEVYTFTELMYSTRKIRCKQYKK